VGNQAKLKGILIIYLHCVLPSISHIHIIQCSGRETTYIQKKQTIYPEFGTSFDAHLYKGRVLQFILMEKPQTLIADATVEAQVLAEKADRKDQKIVNLWVRDTSQPILYVKHERLFF